MRILRLQLKNLNSLAEAEIHFDRPPLKGCGIFAISGPTGAGKTTLLDALTLALYGRVARYDRANPDDVMSRHTAESLAEVDFATPQGRYRASWRRRKAGGKITGKVQPAQREILDLQTGELVTRMTEAQSLIEELTGGLDYDTFCRSVLLPQGQFANFIRAGVKDRGEILEKITGTDIYSLLSMAAYRAKAQAEQDLKERRLLLESVVVLSPEDKAERESQLASQEKAATAKEAELKQASETRQAMDLASRALQRIADAQRTIAETLPHVETAQQHVTAEAAVRAQAVQRRNDAQPLLERALLLDEQIRQAELQAAERKHQHDLALLQATEHEHQKKKTEEQVAAEAERLKNGQKWLTEHQADSQLQEHLPRARELAQHWTTTHHSWQQATERRQRALILKKRHSEAQQTLVKMEHELATARSESDVITTRRQQNDAAQAVQEKVIDLATRILSLAGHRPSLVDGEPCPLCGAKEHPFSTDRSHSQDAQQLEQARTELARLRTEKTHLDRDSLAKAQAIATASQRHTATQRELAQTEQDLTQIEAPDEASYMLLTEQLGAARAQAMAALPSLGLPADTVTVDSIHAALTACEQRATAYQRWTQEFQRIQSQHTTHLAVLATLVPQCQERQLAVVSAHAAWQDVSQSAARVLEDRRSLFAGAPVDTVRQNLERAIHEAEQKALVAQQALEAAQAKVTRARAAEEEAQTQLCEQTGLRPALASLTPEDLAQAILAETDLRGLVQQMAQHVGQVRAELAADEKAQQRVAEHGTQLQQAMAEAGRWTRLSELIGSANGSAFRAFAQELTLIRLIELANARLSRLNPRYRLQANTLERLELEVVDLFQASVRRPLSSLSGGETFLVSLALALGLSDMASNSRQVPIDSLFVDEGFGTLDPDTVEIALDALDALQASGKTIGIISHLPALKDRISTQVVVDRDGDGWSRVRLVP